MSAVAGVRDAQAPGCIDFGGLKVAFDSEVLAPRPWTAAQAHWAAAVSDDVPSGPVLELCCGAGHIGLLAAVLSGRRVVQVDSNPSACRFARLNAERAGIGDEVDIRCCDIATAVRPNELFPLIVADPPYIPSAELGRFPEDPPSAIDGGQSGLDMILLCLDVASGHLLDDGVCLLQVRGLSQVAALQPLAERRLLSVRDSRAVDDERAVALLGRKDVER